MQVSYILKNLIIAGGKIKNMTHRIVENEIISQQMTFTSLEVVELIDCKITDIEDTALIFTDVKKVVIRNCVFKNLGKVLYFGSPSIVKISNSLFENCKSNDNGGIIICSSKSEILLENDIFKNIFNSCWGKYSSAISFANYVESKHCKFYDCKSNGNKLFCYGDYSEKDNEYIKCSQIYGE